MLISHPFATPEYRCLWWSRIGHGLSPFLASGGQAPFVRRRRAGLRILESWGRGYVDYAGLEGIDLREVRALGKHANWDLMLFWNVPSPGPLWENLHSLAEGEGWMKRALFYDVAPYVRLEGAWDGYFNRKSRKFRYNLNRAERKLAEIGPVEVVHFRAPEEVALHMDEAFAIYLRRWRGKSITAPWLTADGRAFYRELALIFAERGWMDLAFLRVGGRAVACCYALCFEGCYYYYVTGIDPDPEVERCSPGMVLIKALLREAFAGGFQKFDFMVGDEPYKRHWATNAQQVYALLLARPGLRGRFAITVIASILRARQAIRRSGLLRRLALRWAR